MTANNIRLLGIPLLLFASMAGVLAAQPTPIVLDAIPKTQRLETVRKAQPDQVFEIQGKRLTKSAIAAQAKANHDRFVAEYRTGRAKVVDLQRRTRDRIGQQVASQKDELEAANAKARAELEKLKAAKR